MHPIFLHNLCDLLGADDCDQRTRIELLLYFAPLGMKWLDRTNVKGDPDAEISAKRLLTILRRYAGWEHLVEAGKLLPIVQLHKRLHGLVGQ